MKCRIIVILFTIIFTELNASVYSGIFIDDSNRIRTHYYYVRDYLGSIRAIVNTDGDVEQTVDYLSTGIPIKGGKGEIIDDRLHTGKQYLSLNGSLLYDNVARYYSPVHGRFTTPDALSSTYPHISHYVHCANNPLSIIDPTGMFNIDEIADNTNYGVVMVVRTDYKDEDKRMNSTGLGLSVNTAKNNNIPIIIVDDLPDFSLALSTINAIETSVTTYVLLSHGTEGQFNIGNTAITSKTDVSSLKSGLSEKNVFLYSCQSAAGEIGSKLLENFSKQTSSTVIGSGHNMRGGYKFDGSSDLTKIVTSIIDGLLNVEIQNDFKISIKGDRSTEIYNFRLTKDGSLMWDLEN